MATKGGANPITLSVAPQQSPSPIFRTTDTTEPEVINKAAILRPLLRNPNEATQVVARVVAVAESFSGPMPHPRHLRGYEDIVPGGAREILEMAKGEQTHRHKVQWLEMIYLISGSLLDLFGLLSCIGAATYLT